MRSGQDVADFAKALRDAIEDVRSFGSGVKGAANAIPGVGFAMNTAAKSMERFARDVAFGTIEDTLKFGAGYAGTALQSNALRGLAALPTDPFQAGQYERPIEATFGRLGGITGPIARAGGSVDMETKRQLANLLYGQERRAEQDALENEWLQGKFTESTIARRGGWSKVISNVVGGDLFSGPAADYGRTIAEQWKKWLGVSVR